MKIVAYLIVSFWRTLLSPSSPSNVHFDTPVLRLYLRHRKQREYGSATTTLNRTSTTSTTESTTEQNRAQRAQQAQSPCIIMYHHVSPCITMYHQRAQQSTTEHNRAQQSTTEHNRAQQSTTSMMYHQRRFHVPEFHVCFGVGHLSPTATCLCGGGFSHHASSAHVLRYAATKIERLND